MRYSLLNRRVHYWATAVLALPILVIVTTGLLLQIKKQWDWVQPPEQQGTPTETPVGFDRLLGALQAEADLGVTGWADVDRLDVRPAKGLVKVKLQSGWEVQLDLATGEVLQTAYRRSDFIEALHDGSFFGGDVTKLGVFLPAGVGLLLLWATGLWLFWMPFSARRRKRAKQAGAAVGP